MFLEYSYFSPTLTLRTSFNSTEPCRAKKLSSKKFHQEPNFIFWVSFSKHSFSPHIHCFYFYPSIFLELFFQANYFKLKSNVLEILLNVSHLPFGKRGSFVSSRSFCSTVSTEVQTYLHIHIISRDGLSIKYWIFDVSRAFIRLFWTF